MFADHMQPGNLCPGRHSGLAAANFLVLLDGPDGHLVDGQSRLARGHRRTITWDGQSILYSIIESTTKPAERPILHGGMVRAAHRQGIAHVFVDRLAAV